VFCTVNWELVCWELGVLYGKPGYSKAGYSYV
jgi:hypothetical protein